MQQASYDANVNGTEVTYSGSRTWVRKATKAVEKLYRKYPGVFDFNSIKFCENKMLGFDLRIWDCSTEQETSPKQTLFVGLHLQHLKPEYLLPANLFADKLQHIESEYRCNVGSIVNKHVENTLKLLEDVKEETAEALKYRAKPVVVIMIDTVKKLLALDAMTKDLRDTIRSIGYSSMHWTAFYSSHSYWGKMEFVLDSIWRCLPHAFPLHDIDHFAKEEGKAGLATLNLLYAATKDIRKTMDSEVITAMRGFLFPELVWQS